MRFNEFKDPNNKEIDEAIPAALGAIGRAGVGLAKGAAKLAGKAVGAAAKAGVKGVKSVASNIGSNMAPDEKMNPIQQKAQQAAQKELEKSVLKRGSKIPLPTQNGQNADYEVDRVAGNEVTLKNPNAKKGPQEPEKVIFKKDDITQALTNMQNVK